MPTRSLRFRFDDIREPHVQPNHLTIFKRNKDVCSDTPRLRKEYTVNMDTVEVYEIVNYFAAFAHLVNVVFILAYEKNSGNVPVLERYLTWECDDVGVVECTNVSAGRINDCLLTPASDTTHELSLLWLIVAFHSLSFVFEYFVTDPLFTVASEDWFPMFYRWRRSYKERVRVGTNYLRFVEYSASASIMLIAIALVNGIYDSYSIIGIAFLSFATMVFGGIAEQLFSDAIPNMERRTAVSAESEEITDVKAPLINATPLADATPVVNANVMCSSKYPMTYHLRKIGWYAHFAGWFTMLAAYGIILRNFIFANMKAKDGQGAPDFVYAIVISIFLFYNVFGFIQLVQLSRKTTARIMCMNVRNIGKKNNRSLNRNIELAYVCASLISKTILGGLITANVLAVEREVC